MNPEESEGGMSMPGIGGDGMFEEVNPDGSNSGKPAQSEEAESVGAACNQSQKGHTSAILLLLLGLLPLSRRRLAWIDLIYEDHCFSLNLLRDSVDRLPAFT